MIKTHTLAAGCALILAGALSQSASAASHDYFIHYVGDNNGWVEAGDVTINNQWSNPMVIKPGACGIRLLGSESTEWVTLYGQHLGTANAADPIDIRLRDLPGCSGAGISISVGGNPVALPNYDIESFFVYQADSFRWLDNSGNVIPRPSCNGCQGPNTIKAAQRNPGWNSAVFSLQNANSAGSRDGGNALASKTILANLRAQQPAATLASVELELQRAIDLRRREATGNDDPAIRDREDTALRALADASYAALRCESGWANNLADASNHCERAARLAERARAAVDVSVSLLVD